MQPSQRVLTIHLEACSFCCHLGKCFWRIRCNSSGIFPTASLPQAAEHGANGTLSSRSSKRSTVTVILLRPGITDRVAVSRPSGQTYTVPLLQLSENAAAFLISFLYE